jgi:hypothetical protein
MTGPKLTLTAAQRAVITLLTSAPSGVTEGAMLAHGFTAMFLAEVVTTGLASAATESTRAGSHKRLRITEVGRAALFEK